MKTRTATMLVVLMLSAITQLAAQGRNITVEATSYDISYDLDLKAIASIFGESRNLADFEKRINSYENRVSNLDLNMDGMIDYLRVIEARENNVNVIVIQAVLERDIFQDVATIVVERDRYNRHHVQVIGDPYMYGYNYIIEPVFVRTPRIVSWLWRPRTYVWSSPYYWGYYPSHFHFRRPVEVNIYVTHVHRYINTNHYYRYTDTYRYNNYTRIHNQVSRNDWSRQNPNTGFTNRNNSVSNKAEIETRSRTADGTRNSTGRSNDYNTSGSRSTSVGNAASDSNTQRNSPNSGVNRSNNDVYNTGTRNSSTSNNRNVENRSYERSNSSNNNSNNR